MLSVLVALALAVPQAGPGVNAVLGDASFVEAYGRAPRDSDGEQLRIRVHLAYVARILRARPGSPARERSLELLEAYIARGEFPRNDGHPDARRPTFIDEDGRICAVGYLIEQTLGRGVAEAIARDAKYAYVDELAAARPWLAAWAATAGLTVEELAMIQPAYGCRRQHPTRVEPQPATFLGGAATSTSGLSLGAAMPLDGDTAFTARASLMTSVDRNVVAGVHTGLARHGGEAGAVAGWIDPQHSFVAHADVVLPSWGTPVTGRLLRPRDAALFAAGDNPGGTLGAIGSYATRDRILLRFDASVSRIDGGTFKRVGGRLAWQLPMVTLGAEVAATNTPATGIAAAGSVELRRSTMFAAATVHYTARPSWGMSPLLLQRIRPSLAFVGAFGDERGYGVMFDLDIPLGRLPVPYFEQRDRLSCD